MPSILIVDDDPIIAQMVSDILCAEGYACGHVSSAMEASQLLEWRRPDLIILDHHMPVMSGAQLLRRIRQSEEFYDLPVIMLTGMAGEADEDQARYNGANDYVRKPFTRDYLLETVRSVFDKLADRPSHRALTEVLAERAAADRRDLRQRSI